MNDFSHSEHAFDPQVLDRLVDGELPETERREVLQTLDHQPDGWRRCAMAFLEAQTWGQTLTHYVRRPSEGDSPAAGSASDGSVSAVTTSTSHDAARSEAIHNGRWRSWVAMAASFLITFGLGIYAQRFIHAPPADGPAPGVAALPVPAVSPGVAPDAGAGSTPTGGVQMVDLNLTTPDGQQQRVRVPLVDSQFAPYVLPPQTPAMPDDVRAALARVGGQLQVKREYWPVQYGNRQAVVPIDRIEIVPVSNRGMQ